MIKGKIYISGKITGLEISEAQSKFKEAEFELLRLELNPVNPMEHVPFNPDWEWKDYMLADIALLFDCEAIYMLDNWGSSEGARIERQIAIEHGMRVLYQ